MVFKREDILAEFNKAYGKDAIFRDDQLEIIEKVLNGNKMLVVKKTGWGKSLVYFLATRIIRKKAKKIALIISPLLALMNNQIESAKKFGLTIETINSTNSDKWSKVFEELRNDEIDALIVSPERLSNTKFQDILESVILKKVGLFVVDEAHCISDWGHDFRPDYRRIVKMITSFSENISILGTTATANNRVVRDIQSQLGDDIDIYRGELNRDSLAIQTINLENREERLCWIKENINKLPGTGIIYCLTIDDCLCVEKWLKSNDISCEIFNSRLDDNDKNNAVEKFLNNEIKVLVATVAFGMGFDKPDIGFVIHFQKPRDIVSYYQQIGRAGRNIDYSVAVLLYGESDDVINQFFIDSAFPTEAEMQEILNVIRNEPNLIARDIERLANVQRTRIEKTLKYLEVEGAIISENYKYVIKDANWNPDLEKSKKITEIRNKELIEMNEFVRTDKCYMEYLTAKLDDSKAHKCNICKNCIGKDLYSSKIKKEDLDNAKEFLLNFDTTFTTRKQWPDNDCVPEEGLKIDESYRLCDGKIMCIFEDSELGQKILADKYERNEFSNEIIDKAVECLKDFVIENDIENVTFVPSLRNPNLVFDMAKKISNKLNLNFFVGLEKEYESEKQATFNNSYFQWYHTYNNFQAIDTRKGNTLLIDDFVKGKWTMTACGYKLLKEGNGSVYPFALLKSAGILDETERTLKKIDKNSNNSTKKQPEWIEENIEIEEIYQGI